MSISKKLQPNTERYLKKIYSRITGEVGGKKNSSNVEDIQKAKTIQNFLRDIKKIQSNIQKGKELNSKDMWQGVENEMFMEHLYNLNPKLFTEFNLISEPTSTGLKFSSDLGNLLEIDLNRAMKVVEASMKGATNNNEYEEYWNSQATKKGVGNKKVQLNDLLAIEIEGVDLSQIPNAIVREELLQAYNMMNKDLQRKNKSGNIKHASFIPQVSGKVDTLGIQPSFTIDIKLELEIRDYAIKLVEALKGASFTAKNYISTSVIHFGNTNPVRILEAISGDRGEELINRFFRMRSCFQQHNSNNHVQAPGYFYRSRAIYELTGVGLTYVDKMSEELKKMLGHAKFLVWNNPFGDILVIPTSIIVKQIIAKLVKNEQKDLPLDWKEALYGDISIPQISLQNISNKYS